MEHIPGDDPVIVSALTLPADRRVLGKDPGGRKGRAVVNMYRNV
jgi:hypothetical protein